MKCRLWEVQYTYADNRRSYRLNGSMWVFANTSQEASATVMDQVPTLSPNYSDPFVMGIQHRGEKTVLWAANILGATAREN